MNVRAHSMAGSSFAVIHRLIKYKVQCNKENKEFDFLTALLKGLLAGFIGWYVARIPDLIDPPTSGYHRGIGHGVISIGGAAVYGYKQTQDVDLPPWLKEIIEDALVGVSSHLILDATTPRGVNLLTKGF